MAVVCRHLSLLPVRSALFQVSLHSGQRAIFAEDKPDHVTPQLKSLPRLPIAPG